MHAAPKRNTLIAHILTISVLILFVFVSLLWSDSQSLIAHDEGLYARRAKLILESGDWLSPFSSPHHKTVGSYWATAISLKLFGISDWASRLPSTVAGLIATILFYLTALRYFKPLNSLIASLALIAMPIYFQSLRTVGPDIIFIALLMAQIYFLISIDDVSCPSSRWKILGFGVCVSLAFFVRSLVIIIPLVSLLPLIHSRHFFQFKEFWFWAVAGLFLGSIPLLFSLLSVFSDHGYAGLISLISFASKKAGMTKLNFFSSFPFYFTRLTIFTFPAFVFFIPRIQSFKKKIFISKAQASKVELNSLTVLFPLIYIIVLSCMGTRHFHYLTPLVPLLALNIGRVDLTLKKSKFKFETIFACVMGVFYLLGACALYLKREDLLNASFYLGFYAVILSSIFCWYVFYVKVISRRMLAPFVLVLAIVMAQYLTLFALSTSGIIWNTNMELKSLANSVNSECRSGAYLYGLPSKDVTILSFYMNNSYVLESLNALSDLPRRCLISAKSAREEIPKHLYNSKISKAYLR